MVELNRNLEPQTLEEIESALVSQFMTTKAIHKLVLSIWIHEQIPQGWSKM